MRVQGETPEVGPNAEGYADADAESEASAEVVVRPSSADVLRVRPRQRMWSATVETVRRRLPELRRGTAATVSASAVATVGTGLAVAAFRMARTGAGASRQMSGPVVVQVHHHLVQHHVVHHVVHQTVLHSVQREVPVRGYWT